MRRMEHATIDQQVAGTTNTDEREPPQIRSLTVPGLLELPPMPTWLRRLLRRTDKRTPR
jgi:hypothetical protein